MTDSHKLAKGVFVNALGTLTKMSRVVYLSVFAHLLGHELFGLYILAYAISEIISKFAILGLESGTMRLTGILLSKDQKAEARWILSRVLVLGFFLSIISTIIAWQLSPWIAEFLMKKPELTKPLQFFCLTIPGLSLTTTVLFSFRNTLDMRYENVVRSFFEPACVLALGFILVKSGYGVLGLALAHALAAAMSLIFSLFLYFKVFPRSERPEKMDWKGLFQTSLPMGGMIVLGIFKMKVDLLIIGRFLPLSTSAIYAAVIEINQATGKIKSLFDPILVPMVQSFHEKMELDRMSDSLILGIRWVMTAVLAVMGTLLVFPQIYLQFFGEHFEQGIAALRIYAIGQAVVSSLGILENILAITGYAYAVFLQSCLMVLANVTLLILFVPNFGLEGAAFISTICLVSISVWRWFFLKKKMKIKTVSTSLIKPLGVFLLLTSVFYVATKLMPPMGIVASASMAALFLLSYVASLVALGLEPTDREMLGKVLSKIRR